MIRGIFGRPFVNLEPYVDLEELAALDDEISLGLTEVAVGYTGGSHKWMGIVPSSSADDPYLDYGQVIAGMSHHAWEARTIPSVAYTDPEVAWMGLSEPEAKAQGIEYDKAVFPWAASGRALGMGREEGLTKVLYEKGTKRILGAGIVGVNAGELIAETVLALEMGADAEDIGLTIHPHPTLSETVYFSAEMAEGTITDMLPKARP